MRCRDSPIGIGAAKGSNRVVSRDGSNQVFSMNFSTSGIGGGADDISETCPIRSSGTTSLKTRLTVWLA